MKESLKKFIRSNHLWCSLALALVTTCILLPTRSFAQNQDQDQDDPPSRVARLGYLQGSVSFEPAGEDQWVGAVPNRPMSTGDQLWSDEDSRAEVQLGSAVIRLSAMTGFSFLNLDDHTVQIQLTAGAINVTVRRLGEDDVFEVDTPNQAFTVFQPGHYRVEASADGTYTVISIRAGEGESTGSGQTYPLHAGQQGTFSGTDQLYAEVSDLGGPDDFDNWAYNRDHRYDNSRSAQYLSHDVVGYEDLDDNGDWRDDPAYGHVWFPNQVEAGWAPYHTGHWDWISPWGWTWVDDSAWGYAPFHYGRWVSVGGRWGWIAGPVAVQPVYAPALVVFIGGGPGGWGGNVGWFPLGPREVYVPSYRVSEAYVTRVNVSSTTVNVTQVTNIYRTTIVNHNTTITNITYANRNVAGAVTAVPQRAFTSAQPVARAAVAVNAQQIAAAPMTATSCGGSHARERAGRKGCYRGACDGASGGGGESSGGSQENSASASGAICKTAAGTGGASWTAAGTKRGTDAASGNCGGEADGEAGASGQAGDSDCGTPGEPTGERWTSGTACHASGEPAWKSGDESAGQSAGERATHTEPASSASARESSSAGTADAYAASGRLAAGTQSA